MDKKPGLLAGLFCRHGVDGAAAVFDRSFDAFEATIN